MTEKKTNKNNSKKKTSGTKTTRKKKNEQPLYTAVKATKKHPWIIFVIVGILVAAVATVAILHFTGVINIGDYLRILTGSTSQTTSQTVSTVTFDGVKYDNFQIHFLELGNWNTGDSVYIKAGDNDILIDAGSKYDSADDVENYIDTYCTDGKLEYVVATHAHEDHIAGFSGGSAKNGIFYHYEIGTIIEFTQHNKNSKGEDSAVYTKYVEAKEYAINRGAKCYTALQAYNNSSLREITLGDGMKMKTLYQKYYEETSDTENNYSVCTLFTYNEQNYLFTGDLEKSGETSLVESNSLPHCELYKAGHHGSKTSSNEKLMEAIQPKVIAVCCCCGSDEYTKTNANQFPTQDFVNRVAPYTSNVYVTSISVDNENKIKASMNGYILFSSNGTEYSVVCSNNQTVLKDTEWFKTNRTTPNEWKTA